MSGEKEKTWEEVLKDSHKIYHGMIPWYKVDWEKVFKKSNSDKVYEMPELPEGYFEWEIIIKENDK